MAKTSQYSVIDPLEVSLGRPITADLLLAISKLVNHAGTPGEEHITCALGSDGWTFPVDSAGNEAGAASSEGPCPVQVASATETTVIDTDVFVAHDGQISGEVFVYGSISSGVVVRVYAQSTWTSSTIRTGNWANIGPATVDAGWNRVRVTLERVSGTGTCEIQSIGLRDYHPTIGDPADA